MRCTRFASSVAAIAAAVFIAGESIAQPQQLSPAAEQVFTEFVTYAPHRTFYVAADGSGHSWSGTNGETPALAIRNGLNDCHERWKTDCRLYAVNNFLLGGRDWRDVVLARSSAAVDIGRLRPQPYWANGGPATASGLLVWSHDYEEGVDRTATAPASYVGHFTKGGYDLYRFDRRWVRDWSVDATHLSDMVKQAKAMGYRRVMLAGLGAGAWISLVAASHGASVDGVIAVAPEFRGDSNVMADAPMARANWQKITASLAAGPRVFIVNFVRNGPAPTYAADARAAFSASGASAVVVTDPPDFPDRPSLQRPGFSRAYGGCLYQFVENGVRRAPCL
jgi:hypothetical protein